MANHEQERPLASETHLITMNDSHDNVNHRVLPPIEEAKTKGNRNKCIKCCGCVTAVVGIIGLIILVLSLTVFKVKDPKINLNNIRIKGLESVNQLNLVPNTNLTIEADLSIKNPNAAAFKFRNATTGIYYENVLIGEAQTPSGTAKANKTFHMKITIDVILQKFLQVGRFLGDLTAGELPVSSQSSIRGKVKVIGITIKKTVGVKLNCSLTVVLASQSIKDMKCKRS